MGSTRLPGKVLKEVLGRPLLFYLTERLKRVKNSPLIILAITTNPLDDRLVSFADRQGLWIFRGSEDNVLERFYLAAKAHSLNVIVRITADCPLMDPAVIDRAIDTFTGANPSVDYVCNTLDRTFPRGMDVEVFSFEALEKCYKAARDPSELEHVTPYIYRHPELFSIKSFSLPLDLSANRWTVDTPEDFILIEKLITALYPDNHDFTLDDIAKQIELHPDWALINQHIPQKKT